jgi:putative oxidoreductase
MKNLIIRNFYLKFNKAVATLQSVFLLLVRIYFGWSFFWAGLGKLQNIYGTAEAFASLGIPYPLFNAYAASLIELVGGACLFLGLGARLAAFALSIVMLVALYTAHYDALLNIYSAPEQLLTQLAFIYLVASMIILIFGPGKASGDYLIEKNCK